MSTFKKNKKRKEIQKIIKEVKAPCVLFETRVRDQNLKIKKSL